MGKMGDAVVDISINSHRFCAFRGIVSTDFTAS
jgi:hypothetical protein